MVDGYRSIIVLPVGAALTSDDDLVVGAGLTGDVAAPLELAVAGPRHRHRPSHRLQSTPAAHGGALRGLCFRVLRQRVHHAGAAFHACEAGGNVPAAVVR